MRACATDDFFSHSGAWPANNGNKPCKTKSPTKTVTGTTSAYDDIIRQGYNEKCLRSDQVWGSSWEVNRLSTCESPWALSLP